LPDVEPGWLTDQREVSVPTSKDQRHDRDDQGFHRSHHRRDRRDRDSTDRGAHGARRQKNLCGGAQPLRIAASDRLVPLKMDVTSDADVNKAAATATDITLLINNAGVNHNTAFLLAADLSIAREEFECNYLAPLRVTRAFAPR